MLPPWVVADKFCLLYPNRIKGIVRPPGWKNWKAVSKHWSIPDQLILSAVAGKEADCFGLRWGEQTRFAVLDIDSRTSQYYNGAKLAELLARLAEVELKANIYQSSASQGWHLYLPFDQPEQSDEVERTLKRWLKAQGYQIINGQLEVFPSGNGLRLPLQPGFAWLDQQSNLVRTREELSTDEALASFLTDLEANARNWAEVKKLIESQISAIDRAAGRGAQAHEKRLNLDGLEQIYSRGKIEDIWEKGRKWWRDGLLNNGERHDAVLAIGHYLWFGDVERQIPALPGSHRNDEYRALLIEQWLNKSHNNKCRHINEGSWEIVHDQIERAVIWRPKKEEKPREPYLLTDRLLKRLIALYRRTGRIWSIEMFEKANQNRKLEARARIAEAICELEDEGTQISIAEVARRAKADWRTVKKNWDLRAAVLVRTLEEKRTSKTETNKDLLACSGGDYNQLGGWGTGAASEQKLLELSSKFFADSENLEDLDPCVPMETTKAIVELGSQAQGNAFDTSIGNDGNYLDQITTAILGLGKITFYPAFGSQRRLVQSLLFGLEGSGRKQNSHDSSELAPIVLTPPYLLPGKKPSNEPPSSISLHSLNGFLPSYAEPSPGPFHLPFRQIDDGSPVRCNLGRTADVAGGLELRRRRQRTGKLWPVHGNQECGTIASLTGLIAVTTCYRSVKILVEIAVNHVHAVLSASCLKRKGAKSPLTGCLRLVTRRKVRGPPTFSNSRKRMQRARKGH